MNAPTPEFLIQPSPVTLAAAEPQTAANDKRAKIDTLQVGRGIAAFSVLLFHTEVVTQSLRSDSILKRIFDAGWSGVDYFFVLSGFLMMWVHRRDLGRPSRTGNYLRKRVLRIYPVYWVLCALILVAQMAVPALTKSDGKLPWWALVDSLFLVPHHGPRLIGVTWTLEYEVVFYAIFAVLLLSRKIGITLLVGWGAAVVAVLFFGPPAANAFGIPALSFFPLAFLLNAHCLEFLLGISVAATVKAGFTLPRPGFALIGSIAFYVAFLIYDTVFQVSHRDIRVAIVVYALASGSVLLSSVLFEQRYRPKFPGWLQELGAASYAIYLTHFLVISAAHSALMRVHGLQSAPALLIWIPLIPVALLPGFLLHRFVERPLLKRFA